MALTQGLAGGSSGGAVTVVDGGDVALGVSTDAAVTGDNSGTVNAHLRGLDKITGDVWDSVNHRLRVDGSGVTQPVSAASLPLPAGAAQDRTTAAAPGAVELSDGAAFYTGAKTGQFPSALVGGRLDVTLGAAPAAVTLGAGAAAVGTVGVTSSVTPADRTATGSVAATNATVALTPNGCGTVTAAIATNASWNGTLTFQATTDGSNWLAIGALNVNTGAFGQTYATANTNALFQLSTAGYSQVRVIALTYSAGSATVTLEGSAGSSCFPGLLDSAGRLEVVGAAAAGAALAGNPVLCGAEDSVGNAAPLLLQSAGISPLRVVLYNGISQISTTTPTDGQVINVNPIATRAINGLYNGTTEDLARNSIDATLLTSGARTTTQSGTITTYNLGAIKFVLDVTVNASGSVTFSVTEVDPASGKSILLLTGVAVASATGTFEYTVDPMVPAVANVSAQKRVPRTINWNVTANNANSVTASLGSMQLPA